MKKKLLSTILLFLFLLNPNKSFSKESSMDYKNVYFVILAGGSGTRLWPISRKEKPKQFIPVGDKKTLIKQAIHRIAELVPKDNIWISTTQEHAQNIKLHVENDIGNIVIEPGLRNTGPAILLACMKLHKHNPKAAVVFLTADHFIPDKQKFVNYLKQAIDFTLKNEHITLLGLKPKYPATGYGYIEFDNINRQQAPFKVATFHEKPDLKTAQSYIKKNNILWNSGMFCGKTSVFIQEFKKEANKIYEGVSNYLQETGNYNDIKSDSIDYAIMEKSKNIFVLPVDFPWCDVGNIEVFLSIQKENMQLKNNIVSVDSDNNLIDVKNKLVALIGINDLCIVETDGILLITKKNQSEKVKTIVKKLKKSDNKKYL